MTATSSAAEDLATGSQDLAALAGLFCTDGVEGNALATQSRYGTVVVSSLSLLGMLGLVKSTIKLALGLEACSNVGFSLDSLRGIYGYRSGEIPSEGKLYEFYDTKVNWIDVSDFYSDFGPSTGIPLIPGQDDGVQELQIQKNERLLCDKLTPMVGVAQTIVGHVGKMVFVDTQHSTSEAQSPKKDHSRMIPVSCLLHYSVVVQLPGR